jgi:translin
MDLSPVSDLIRSRLDERIAARERGLPAARRSIRASANAIRAIHRGEIGRAHELMGESRAALDEGQAALAGHPEVYYAGFIQDAEKEYAEARLTEVLIAGADLVGPDEARAGLGPYLNGMAEAIGEGRRAILDQLRTGDVREGERILSAMEEMYAVLVTMDYPDAVTGNLRRSTDVARSLIEKTRGDLTSSIVQDKLREALERHARDVLGRDPG